MLDLLDITYLVHIISTTFHNKSIINKMETVAIIRPINLVCAVYRRLLLTDCKPRIVRIWCEFRPKKDVVNTIHCHALDDSPLRPKGLDVFDNPQQRFNSKQVTVVNLW